VFHGRKVARIWGFKRRVKLGVKKFVWKKTKESENDWKKIPKIVFFYANAARPPFPYPLYKCIIQGVDHFCWNVCFLYGHLLSCHLSNCGFKYKKNICCLWISKFPCLSYSSCVVNVEQKSQFLACNNKISFKMRRQNLKKEKR
jgi:hypothetical protein